MNKVPMNRYDCVAPDAKIHQRSTFKMWAETMWKGFPHLMQRHQTPRKGQYFVITWRKKYVININEKKQG